MYIAKENRLTKLEAFCRKLIYFIVLDGYAASCVGIADAAMIVAKTIMKLLIENLAWSIHTYLSSLGTSLNIYIYIHVYKRPVILTICSTVPFPS